MTCVMEQHDGNVFGNLSIMNYCSCQIFKVTPKATLDVLVAT